MGKRGCALEVQPVVLGEERHRTDRTEQNVVVVGVVTPVSERDGVLVVVDGVLRSRLGL